MLFLDGLFVDPNRCGGSPRGELRLFEPEGYLALGCFNSIRATV